MQARKGTPEGSGLLVIDNPNEMITVAGNNRKPRRGESLQDIGIMKEAALVIKNGIISEVGPRKEVLASVDTDNAIIIDAAGKTVMPGFVDPHTHLVFAGSRENELRWKIEGASYIDIASKGGGILSTVNATREASSDELLALASNRLDIMMRHGTTSIEVKSGYGLNVEAEMMILEVARALSEEHKADVSTTFLGAHAIPPEFKDHPEGYVDQVIDRMIPRVADEELADFCDVFCEEGFFDVEQSRAILEEGKTYGLVPKLHADELSDVGGANLAAEVGAISADHLEKSSDGGIGQMAEANVVGVLLPGTSFSTNIGYADARRMIDLGLPVALATDFNPNCWTKSMQFMISLACYKMRMFPAEAVVASTINAAHATGRARDVGSLETGKQGDIIILDIENHEQIPYRFASNHVDMVIKRGEIVHTRV
ncbi:MAG: imidazolonepropionase [Thermoplasmata archaeon]|nr:imidazolonepropionase [Thermoplasmata archaeon]